MTAAATNRVSLAFVEEVTFGVTPSSPTLKNIRFTSESLKQTTATAESAEIVSDRQIPDVVRTVVGADGDINFELYAGDSLETLIKHAIQSPAKVAGATSGTLTITVTAATGQFLASAGTPFSAAAAGEWMHFTGFANDANNGYFRIASIVSAGQGVTTDQRADLVNETAATGIVAIQASYYTNGTTQTSMTIEKKYEDLSSQFEVHTGMTISGMSLSVPADNFVTGGLTFMGKSSSSGTSTVGSGSNTAASTNPAMNGVDSPVVFYENDVALSFISMDMTMASNLRARHNAGDAFAESIGTGKIGITGTFTAYFTSAAALDRYLAGTASSLALVLADSNGNVIALDLPQVRFTSGQRVAGGQDQDVIAEIGFTAYKHPTLGHTFRVSTF